MVVFSCFGEFDTMKLVDHEISISVLYHKIYTFLRAIYSEGIFLVAAFIIKLTSVRSFSIWALRLAFLLTRIMIHCWMMFESREYFSLQINPSWRLLKPWSLISVNSSETLISFSNNRKNCLYRFDWKSLRPWRIPLLRERTRLLLLIVR